MKKVFANLVIFITVLLVGLVALPWNNIGQWAPVLALFGTIDTAFDALVVNQPLIELYIKGGIGALLFLLSLVFLFVSNYEQKNYGHVNRSTAFAAYLPPLLFSLAALIFAGINHYEFFYFVEGSLSNKVILYSIIAAAVNIAIFSHFFASMFRTSKIGARCLMYFLAFELMLVSMGVGLLTFSSNTRYAIMSTYNYILIPAVFLGLYIVYAIVIVASKKKTVEPEENMEETVKEIRKEAKAEPESNPAPVEHKVAKENKKVVRETGNKTMIVSREQTIISGEQNVDPTNMLYEEVPVDPEFNKTSNLDKQVNTIEYYIEKPKLFKPLDPTFDQLVGYVRELPNVVTKISDDKITFYIERKAFLVLMNYGNYYRIAFRSELEKGIRLIIKYPTISKNKAAKDDIWFKANNYGDLPKEVIYDICKSAYDSVSL